MITFKQFLAEARMAPLYHKTDLVNFYYILRNGAIEPRTTHQGHSKPGVSLTRSIKTAFDWKSYESGVVIEIDQQKLIQNKRVKPINIVNIWYKNSNRFNAKSEELFEEFVTGPIESKYFKRFIVPSRTVRSFSSSVFADLRSLRDMNVKVYIWDEKKTVSIGDLEIPY